MNANQKEQLRQYAASMGEQDSSKGSIFGKKKK